MTRLRAARQLLGDLAVGIVVLVLSACAASAPSTVVSRSATVHFELSDSDREFLGKLTARGIRYEDPGKTVQLGRSMCEYTARPGASWDQANDIASSNGFTRLDGAYLVGAAIGTYCPDRADDMPGAVSN